MLAVLLLDLGGLAVLAGGLALALNRIGGGSTLGVLVLSTGVVAVVAGLRWPARMTRAPSKRSQLDEFVPEYQFFEVHSIDVRAPLAATWKAILAVTAREISFFRTLTWIRRAGRPGPEGILNPPPDAPILAVATRTTFITLAEIRNAEVVLGMPVIVPSGWRPDGHLTPEGFRELRLSGFALAAMSFRIEEAAAGCRVTTETRILATDAIVRRRFALYWRLIYPGSAFIRRMWLRAIKRRAEGRQAPQPPTRTITERGPTR